MVTKQDIQRGKTFTIRGREDGDEFMVIRLEEHPVVGTIVTSILVGKHTEPGDGYLYQDEINYFVNFLNDFCYG
tara:strand:- start:1094 stop:1315 length:222 start_codon:yes stop_codon:yes gene_type:complete